MTGAPVVARAACTTRGAVRSALETACHAPYAVIRSNGSIPGDDVASLMVRNLDAELVLRQLRIRAAEHGRSAQALHCGILRAALAEEDDQARRQAAMEKLSALRRDIFERHGQTVSTVKLLRDVRAARMRQLAPRKRKP